MKRRGLRGRRLPLVRNRWTRLEVRCWVRQWQVVWRLWREWRIRGGRHSSRLLDLPVERRISKTCVDCGGGGAVSV